MSRSIVTRKGDDGSTSLLYGQRVSKTHPQIEAVGAFDELNAALGVAKANSPSLSRRDRLEALQKDLVSLMGEIACHESDRERYAASSFPKVDETTLARIDAEVAELEAKNLRFEGWATPGATPHAASLDVARTLARRAERRLADLAPAGRHLRPAVLPLANRIADLLWLMARDAETEAAQH
ncbi:MAG TPA: cob(I)yrinic acid a,c-diamide adenosyltransferase [Opitutaceae bacterium]|nr:cob(I)yrinic acid a,c-diamide adenosyltransferase [Opitutaceae bacterium]